MNYLYIALALREAGREINEANMRKMLAALDVEANEAEMQFFISALASLATSKTCSELVALEERRAATSSLILDLTSSQERLEGLEGSIAAISDRVAVIERGLAMPHAKASRPERDEVPIEEGIEPVAPAEVPHPGPLPKGEGTEAQPGEAAVGDDARYVYGIADKGVAVSLGPIGLEGSEVYTIPYKGVCAIVHNCPAQPYKSDDDEVVKGWVLTHQKVLDAAMERFETVLPMGFDTIIQRKDEADLKQVVKDWLEENYDDLQEKMARVRGKQEFGVQILWDPKVIARQITETSEEIKALDEEMKSKPEGTAYMYKQKLEKLLKQKMEERADECFKEFYAKIKNCVDDIVVEKTKRIEEDKQMLMNLSCLVHKDKVEGLGEELEEIEGMEGFSVRFTGPWPPYSFVTPGKV